MLEREREREITGCRRAVIGDGGESCDSAKMEVMERYVRYCVMVFTVFQFLLLILLCSLIRFLLLLYCKIRIVMMMFFGQ